MGSCPTREYHSTDILRYHNVFILFACTLLKVVYHYCLSLLSMPVMGLNKNVHTGWVGGVELYPVYVWTF